VNEAPICTLIASLLLQTVAPLSRVTHRARPVKPTALLHACNLPRAASRTVFLPDLLAEPLAELLPGSRHTLRRELAVSFGSLTPVAGAPAGSDRDADARPLDARRYQTEASPEHLRRARANVAPVLRPALISVGEALLALETDRLSLDQVAEAIGTLRVTPDEIDELMYWLETHGRPIADPVGKGAAALLGEVLVVARTLRSELGRPPQPREIAERSGLSMEAVQRALWFARILQR